MIYSLKKAISFGILVWLIPFVISLFFYNSSGDLLIDKFLFKSIMIVTSNLVGTYLLIHYFKQISDNFLKEGLLIGCIWLTINWGLDMVILLPLAKLSFSTYFFEIGLRYIGILISSIGFGYLLYFKMK